MVSEAVKTVVKAYILEQFLPGEDPNVLNDETELVTGGILDSLASLKLVSFLEERFGVSVEAHEVDVDHLNTISDIEKLIISKSGRG